MIKYVDDDFFAANDTLICAMSEVIEGKMARLVKHALPVMLEFKAHIGEKALADRAFGALKTLFEA